MYSNVSQFCWPDSKINDANKRRQCAQETVVSRQLINPFTKTTLFDPIKPPSSISTKDTAAISLGPNNESSECLNFYQKSLRKKLRRFEKLPLSQQYIFIYFFI